MTIEAIKPERFPWFDYRRYTFSLGLDLGDWVVLSGHSASEYDPGSKRIVVRGSMKEQTRTAYDKIATLLDAAGYGLEDVVRIVEYVTGPGVGSYPDAEEVRANTLGAHRPAINTVVVNRLLRPDALIEIEVTAARKLGVAATDTTQRPAYSQSRATDSVTYLSSILPRDESGKVVGGDLTGQARRIFENAAKLLATLGIGWDHVVKTVDYITPPVITDYKSTGKVRRDFLGPVYPAATGVIVERLMDPDAKIQVDFIASAQPPEAVNPGWSRYERLTYNPAVRAGGILFMSGQAALDPETERAVHEGDVVAQTEYTYANIAKVLSAAGLGPQNLIKTIEYITPEGLDRYRETAAVRTKLLKEPFPASTGLVCDRLLRPEFLIEVDPTAVFDR